MSYSDPDLDRLRARLAALLLALIVLAVGAAFGRAWVREKACLCDAPYYNGEVSPEDCPVHGESAD